MSDHDPHLPPEAHVQQAIRDLDPVHADPGFRSRLRQRFVTGTLADEEKPRQGERGRRRWLWAWILTPAAAAAATLLVLLFPQAGWEVREVQGDGPLLVEGQAVAARDTERLARLLGPGARLQVPEGTTLDLLAVRTVLLRLAEGADVSISGAPTTSEPTMIRLRDGEIRIRTGPRFAGHGLTVGTTEGRVELTGTVVSVFKGNGFTCVCVLEGTASIGQDAARMERIDAGSRKVMFAAGQAMVTALEPHHAEGLQRFVAATREVF